MSLQGSLDTFALPDILRFLATTEKTGCLHLEGDRGRGRIWLDQGALLATAVNRTTATSALPQAIFEMMRFRQASFSFAPDEPPPQVDRRPENIESALEHAARLMDEWRWLEAVVPSLGHRVALAAELTDGQVVLDASHWSTLAAIGDGCTVAELAQQKNLGEFDVTRAVSDLVELGVAVVGSPG